MDDSNDSNRAKPTQAMELIKKSLAENDRPVVLLEDGGTGLIALVHGAFYDVAKMIFTLLASEPELEMLVVPNLIRRRVELQKNPPPMPSIN